MVVMVGQTRKKKKVDLNFLIIMGEQDVDVDPNVELWKVKKLIKSLTIARGALC
jgi:hypothetical protein